MVDPSIVKERLLTKETVPSGRGSLEKVLQKFKILADLVRARNEDSDAALNESEVTDAQIIEAKEQLRRDLMLHQLEVRKLVQVERAVEADRRNCKGELQVTLEKNEVLRKEMVELKQQLASERLIRSRREEYDALAKVLNRSTASRRETENKLNEVSLRLSQLREKRKQAIEDVDVREKQFCLLLQSIYDLKATLSKEDKVSSTMKTTTNTKTSKDGTRMRKNDGSGDLMEVDS